MKKKILLIAVLAIGLMACNGESKNNTKTPKKIEAIQLSDKEKELANGNPNIGAQLLVRKAVLKELDNAELNDDEKFNLNIVKEEAAINFYLQKVIGQKLNVTVKEVQDFYQTNKEKFGNKSLEEVANSISNLLILQKQNESLANYYNSLVEKYNLNDSLKKEFPEEKKNAEVEKKEEKK